MSRPIRHKIYLLVIFTILTLQAPTFAIAGTSTPTMAQRAEVLYESAGSMFKARKFDQAKEILDQFVKKYPSSHRTPFAYLQIAFCALKANPIDTKSFDEAISICTSKYSRSPESYRAYGAWLREARRRTDKKLYLKIFQEMLSKKQLLKQRLPSFTSKTHALGQASVKDIFKSSIKDMSCEFATEGWHVDTLWAVQDNASAANQILGDLAWTLKECKGDLLPRTQYTHYRLLVIAGRKAEAEQVLASYISSWGKDTRGVRLRLMILWDDKIESLPSELTKEIWDELITKYVRYNSLTSWTSKFIQALASKNDFTACLELTKAFLASRVGVSFHTYTKHTNVRPGWIGTITGLAKRKPNPLEGDRFIPAIKFMLDHAPKHDAYLLGYLTSLANLQIAAGKKDDAIKTATSLLENHWSKASFDTVTAWASTDRNFRNIIDTTWKKLALPLPEPAAKKAYDIFRQKFTDKRVKVADELADEMLKNHPTAAETAQAASTLVVYYFSNSMPTERDIWAKHMVKYFPKHPLTHQAMRNQFIAAKADRNPKVAGEWLDLIAKNFQSGRSVTWIRDRFWCYENLDTPDYKNRWETAKKYYTPAAKAGSVIAQAYLGINEIASMRLGQHDLTAKGDFWFNFGKNHKSAKLKAKCYRHAFEIYITVEGAVKALDALQKLAFDEETKWLYAFEQINILLRKRDAVAEIIKALAKTKISGRDISLRLNMPRLGDVLGKESNAKTGISQVSKIKRLCNGYRDDIAFSIMMGNLLKSSEDNKKKFLAAKYFFSAANEARFPAQMKYIFNSGLDAACKSGNIKAFTKEIDAYKIKLRSAQSVLPEVLYNIGYTYLKTKNPKAYRIRSELARYSASTYKDKLEEVFRKTFRKKTPKKNNRQR